MSAPASLHRFHTYLADRPALAIALVLALSALCAVPAVRVQLDSDMAALLPGGPDSPREAAQLLADFGALDTLLVEVQFPGADTDALIDAGLAARKVLEASAAFKDVRGAPESSELFALSRVLLPRRLYLLDDPLAVLEARLRPDALAASLGRLKEQLTAPEALGLKAQLLADPLGLNGALLEGLASSAGDFDVQRGALLSKDHQALLWIATPAASALSVDESEKVMAAVDKARAALPQGASLRAAGGPRFVVESARLIKDDMFFNIFSSAATLLVIFWLRFRGWRLLVLATVPLLMGLLAGVAGAAALQGRIHGLSLGFGAAMVGIADDYSLHIFNRAWADPGELRARLRHAVDEAWGSLWLAFITTMAGFAVVWSSDFPALRELATFAAIGIAVAFAVTLVLLPPLASFLAPKATQPLKRTPSLIRSGLSPRLSLALVLGVMLVSGVLATRITFDGELRNLDAQQPRTLADYDEVMRRFGMLDSNALVVSQGADAEQALRQNDQTFAALKADRTVTSLRSLAQVLPSQATQRARGAALSQLDLSAAKAALAAGAQAAGFSASAFDGFWAEVQAAAKGTVEPMTPAMLTGTSLGALVSRSLRCAPGQCRAVAAFARPDNAGPLALPAGVKLVEATALTQRTLQKIPRQLWLMSGLGLLLNLVLLSLAYRSLKVGLLVCVPCVLGLLAAVGGFALVGRPLDIVSASALVLVLGCSVDYGIFVMQGLQSGQEDGVDAVGVLLASFTTVAGFGTMAFASHPALNSLGWSISIGILVSGAAALVLVPGLFKLLRLPAASAAAR